VEAMMGKLWITGGIGALGITLLLESLKSNATTRDGIE
jgi:hypothetical protein